MKRPSFQFYPGDWLQDANLRICSSGARGLWIDMLALMHQATPYGHLVFNGKAATPLTLSRMVSSTPREVAVWVKELDEAGVFSRNDAGVIYSRRMVRDELVRNARANGGHKGGRHGEKGGLFGPLGGRPKGGSETPLITPPFRAEGEEAVGVDGKDFHLPQWINSQTWVDYLAMRVKIRKPATERAMELIVKELDDFRIHGQDPNAVLEQSIANSWQGVFEVKAKNGKGGITPIRWKAGAEPAEVLVRVAREMQLPAWQVDEGETHGQFRRRIVEAGGEKLLAPPRAA